jgi:hypothetical protein
MRGLLPDEKGTYGPEKTVQGTQASNLSGHAGGPATERKVALCALMFQNRKIGCVANMTDRFSPVRGSEAVTRRDAVSVSTAVLAMRPPKRGVGHGQNCGVSEPSAGNASDGIGTFQSKR